MEEEQKEKLYSLIKNFVEEELKKTDIECLEHQPNCIFHKGEYECNCEPLITFKEQKRKKRAMYNKILNQMERRIVPELKKDLLDRYPKGAFNHLWLINIFKPNKFTGEDHPLIRILNFIWQETTKPTDSSKLSKYVDKDKKTINIVKVDKEKKEDVVQKHNLVLFTVDYDEIGENVFLSPRQCKRYISEMKKAEIINKLAQEGEGGKAIYSIGYWVGKGKHMHRQAFLRDTKEFEERLRKMKFRDN